MSILKNMIDSNQSGAIDYSEFITLSVKHKKLLTKKNLIKAFKKLDNDGSGNICISELRKVFEGGAGVKRSEEFWNEFVKEIDKDQDN
jgi:Ca2+-binding EF-hand superfamily protein